MDCNLYLGFSDKPFDEAFDLIMQGMPTVAMLTVERVLRFADAGMEFDADDLTGMRKLSAALADWSEWTSRGERYPLRHEDEDYLEHLTGEASKLGIEAWRELSVQAGTRRMLAEEWGDLFPVAEVESAEPMAQAG